MTGCLLTQDPIGLAGGVNLYAYAGNNPVAFSDPWGLDCQPNDSICKQRVQNLIAAQDRARTNPIFSPHAGRTFCNQATCATAREVGAPMGPLTNARGEALLANEMGANLAKEGSGYHSVTAEQAQSLANDGNLVIGAGPGHVATVRPQGVSGDTPQGRAPIINNIGAQNVVTGHNYVIPRSEIPSYTFYTPDK